MTSSLAVRVAQRVVLQILLSGALFFLAAKITGISLSILAVSLALGAAEGVRVYRQGRGLVPFPGSWLFFICTVGLALWAYLIWTGWREIHGLIWLAIAGLVVLFSACALHAARMWRDERRMIR